MFWEGHEFCQISTVNLSYESIVTVKSTAEISQDFVAFSENINFIKNEKQKKSFFVISKIHFLQLIPKLYNRNDLNAHGNVSCFS